MTTHTAQSTIPTRLLTTRERIEVCLSGRVSRDFLSVTLKRALDAIDAVDRRVRLAEQDRDRFSREASAARRERDEERAASDRLRAALRDLVDSRHRGPR